MSDYEPNRLDPNRPDPRDPRIDNTRRIRLELGAGRHRSHRAAAGGRQLHEQQRPHRRGHRAFAANHRTGFATAARRSAGGKDVAAARDPQSISIGVYANCEKAPASAGAFSYSERAFCKPLQREGHFPNRQMHSAGNSAAAVPYSLNRQWIRADAFPAFVLRSDCGSGAAGGGGRAGFGQAAHPAGGRRKGALVCAFAGRSGNRRRVVDPVADRAAVGKGFHRRHRAGGVGRQGHR